MIDVELACPKCYKSTTLEKRVSRVATGPHIAGFFPRARQLAQSQMAPSSRLGPQNSSPSRLGPIDPLTQLGAFTPLLNWLGVPATQPGGPMSWPARELFPWLGLNSIQVGREHPARGIFFQFGRMCSTAYFWLTYVKAKCPKLWHG